MVFDHCPRPWQPHWLFTIMLVCSIGLVNWYHQPSPANPPPKMKNTLHCLFNYLGKACKSYFSFILWQWVLRLEPDRNTLFPLSKVQTCLWILLPHSVISQFSLFFPYNISFRVWMAAQISIGIHGRNLWMASLFSMIMIFLFLMC